MEIDISEMSKWLIDLKIKNIGAL